MIGAVEDAIVEKIRELVGSRIKVVETLPGALDAAELKRRLRIAPAIYVSFLGGQPREENELVIDAEFGVFFLVQGPRELTRRRGDETRSAPEGMMRTGGAYSLLQAVAPYLQGFVVPGVGSLHCTGVHNLFAEELDAEGVSLYSASYSIPVQLKRLEPADLEAFLTFHADWIFPPHAVPPQGTKLPLAQPDATDIVDLPQAQGNE
jgi:phage gp37-like protein